MATSGMDRKIKIWDLRKNYTPVSEFKVPAGASSLHFSSTGLLAASMGNTAYVYKVSEMRFIWNFINGVLLPNREV